MSNLPVRYQPHGGERVINASPTALRRGEGIVESSDYLGPIVAWDSGFRSYLSFNHHLRVL